MGGDRGPPWIGFELGQDALDRFGLADDRRFDLGQLLGDDDISRQAQ